MPIRIDTAAMLDNVSSEISFCYLCGRKIPPKTRTGRGADVDGDHVVPKALLREFSTPTSTPIVLPVHRDCHAMKSASDEAIALIHRGLVNSDKPLPDQIRSLKLRPTREVVPIEGEPTIIHGFDGPEVWRVRQAVVHWVRGFHAILYGSFLPNSSDRLGHSVMTPLAESINDQSIAEVDKVKGVVGHLLTRPSIQRKADTIVAWDNRVVYRAIWMPSLVDSRLSLCVWMLETPGTDRLRDGTPFRARFPWMGSYPAVHRPPNCATLPKVIPQH